MLVTGGIGIGKTTLLNRVHSWYRENNPSVRFIRVDYDQYPMTKPPEYFKMNESGRSGLAAEIVKKSLGRFVESFADRGDDFDALRLYEFVCKTNPEYLSPRRAEERERVKRGQDTSDLRYELLREMYVQYPFESALLKFKEHLKRNAAAKKVVLVIDNFDQDDVHIQSQLISCVAAYFIPCLSHWLERNEIVKMKAIIAARDYTFKRALKDPERNDYFTKPYRPIHIDLPPNLASLLRKRLFLQYHRQENKLASKKVEYTDDYGKKWTVDQYAKFLGIICVEFSKTRISSFIYEVNNNNVRRALPAVLKLMRNPYYFKPERLLGEAIVQSKELTPGQTLPISSVIYSLAYGAARYFPVEDSCIVNILCAGYRNEPENDFLVIRTIQTLIEAAESDTTIGSKSLIDKLSAFYQNARPADVLDRMYEKGLVSTETHQRPSISGEERISLQPKARCLLNELCQGSMLTIAFRDDSWLPKDLSNEGVISERPDYDKEVRLTLEYATYIIEREEAEILDIKRKNLLPMFRKTVGERLISEIVMQGIRISMTKYYGRDRRIDDRYTPQIASLTKRAEELKTQYSAVC